MFLGKLLIDSFYTVKIGEKQFHLGFVLHFVLLEEALGFLRMNCCSTRPALHTELPSIYNIASVHSLFHYSGALNNLNLSVGLSALFNTQPFHYCPLTPWRPLLMSLLSVCLSALWSWRCEERGGTDLTFHKHRAWKKNLFFSLALGVVRCRHADISPISVRLSVKQGGPRPVLSLHPSELDPLHWLANLLNLTACSNRLLKGTIQVIKLLISTPWQLTVKLLTLLSHVKRYFLFRSSLK